MNARSSWLVTGGSCGAPVCGAFDALEDAAELDGGVPAEVPVAELASVCAPTSLGNMTIAAAAPTTTRRRMAIASGCRLAVRRSSTRRRGSLFIGVESADPEVRKIPITQA